MASPSTTRETLLDAALHLLEERGPGALRIRDLAEAAEQSTMGVYTHFGSKQGLLEQLLPALTIGGDAVEPVLQASEAVQVELLQKPLL